jgi:hypothetical protein
MFGTMHFAEAPTARHVKAWATGPGKILLSPPEALKARNSE